MRQLFLCLSILLISSASLLAQSCSVSVVLQPDGTTGVDALVSNYSTSINNNYGSNTEFEAYNWTIGGTAFINRSFIRFDLSAIPVNAVVQQAVLMLYNNPTSPDNSGAHFGSNSGWLEKVTASWNENTITWNNQPPTTTTNRMVVPQSTSAHEDYTLDITTLAQGMITNPATNYGLMFRSQTEVNYRALIFCSSDYSDPTKRPKLSITYILPENVATITAAGPTAICPGGSVVLNANTGVGLSYQWQLNGANISGATLSSYSAQQGGNYSCIVSSNVCSTASNEILVSVSSTIHSLTLQPNGTVGVDALVSNYSTSINNNYGANPEFEAYNWTISSTPFINRSFIRFDFSSLPANATILQAKLTLYNNPTTPDGEGAHSSLSGSNAGWLQRVTSPWNESTITWNNQPSTTTANQVAVPQSTSEHQDYDLDITTLAQAMAANQSTNYGFMLRSQTEVNYRALIFASSDYSDSTKRPKLSIIYSLPMSCTPLPIPALSTLGMIFLTVLMLGIGIVFLKRNA
jgi:hypothetical protein